MQRKSGVRPLKMHSLKLSPEMLVNTALQAPSPGEGTLGETGVDSLKFL